MYQAPKSHHYGVNTCSGCLQKQLEIDRLQQEISSLKAQLRYRQRQDKLPAFSSSTPSSKLAYKANSTADNQHKQGGAKVGHKGHGRRKLAPDQVDNVCSIKAPTQCPDCGDTLMHKGCRARCVLDIKARAVERTNYQIERKYCQRCRKSVEAVVEGVLPRAMIGNQLTAEILTSHYLHGETMGRIAEKYGIGIGTLLEMAHRVAGLFKGAVKYLSQEYRQSYVRHADETGWRCDGKSGYAWLFATEKISIYLFRQSRGSVVAKEIIGQEQLEGVLVVDRYNAYNKAPCKLQYCYAHIMRDVEDIGKEFDKEEEVQAFVSELIPQLAKAMHLRRQAITDQEYYKEAKEIKAEIEKIVNVEAKHLAIRKIQDLFIEKAERLYQWVEDRRVPADNNRAERELRPTVIARKVSFGSQSEAGTKTREIMLSVMGSLKKQVEKPEQRIKEVLDEIVRNPGADAVKLLWAGADTS
jgi:transposase